jgi:hypothetical protein
MSRDQNVVENRNIMIGNISFESVTQLKCLGKTLNNKNSTHEKIRKLKSRNVYYHLMQNLLSPSLLPKSVNIKTYRIISLSVLLYGCETWLLTLWEEIRLRVLENRMLRRIFGSEREEVTGKWKRLHKKEL